MHYFPLADAIIPFLLIKLGLFNLHQDSKQPQTLIFMNCPPKPFIFRPFLQLFQVHYSSSLFGGYAPITFFYTLFLTSSGGLKAIEQVDPLNIVGESCVGHQGLITVYIIYSKLEGQFVHAH